MLKIQGQTILGGDDMPIGVISGTHIRAKGSDKDLGYWEGNTLYDPVRTKLGYLEGAYFYPNPNSRSTYISLDEMKKKVKGDVADEITRCAVFKLFEAE